MKTTLTLISIIAAISVIAVYAKISSASETTEVVVIRDVTDKMAAIPKADEIISLFDLSNEIWNGGIFRFVDLSDVSINSKHEASIKPENQWLSNKFQRRDKVKNFYSEINKIISDASKEKIGKDNSSVYYTIAEELNKLSQSISNKKILLVYSDMMENANKMSFYDKQKLELLKTNPDSIKKYFDSLIKLNNLNGIKIELVFQPLNMMEDETYKVVSNFYKTMLESKGAIVEITASIN